MIGEKEIGVKKLSRILGIAISATVLFGIGWKVDSYYAKAAKLQLVEMRLDQKIKSDKRDFIQRRLWQLEDRYRDRIMPPSVREEYRRLKMDLQRGARRK